MVSRVLIACETSGRVRDAFIVRGHDAMSCDLQPSDSPGPHYQGDVRDVLHACWDLMIAHPECTHLSVSGALRFDAKRLDGRQAKAAAFFMEILRAPVPRVCVENPVGIMSTLHRPPDQIVQPYEFGHDASKATCLWLRGLPPLKKDPAKRVPGRRVDLGDGRSVERWANQADSGQNRLSQRDDRWKRRAETYQGIADAMAEQWGAALALGVCA